MVSGGKYTTTAACVAGSIGVRIISGALQPDVPLRQDHIARECGSIDIPAREAFRQLEAQRLVVALPCGGAPVAPLDIAPCAMPRLLASLDGLRLADSRSVFATATVSAGDVDQEHRLILQALRARDVHQASSLLGRHVEAIERLQVPADGAMPTFALG